MTRLTTIAGAALLSAAATIATAAPVNNTGFVTSEIIMGDGIGNGGWTGVSNGLLELALRAKLRFNAAGEPEDTFNYDGDRTYSFSNQGNPENRSVFNFEFSINTDVTDETDNPSQTLTDLTFALSIDRDPSAGTDFLTFDPLLYGGSFGFNSTPNGDGVNGSPTGFNVAQNSQNLGFGYTGVADPDGPGTYTFRLSAFDGDTLLLATDIDVEVAPVPLPAGLPLLALGLGALGIARRRA